MPKPKPGEYSPSRVPSGCGGRSDQASSNHARGVTADRYGLRGYPAVIVIGRTGKIAFHCETAAGVGNLSAVFTQMGRNPMSMTERKVNELVERTLADEIERALEQKD